MLRRLDCVLAGTKDPVLKRQAEVKGEGLLAILNEGTERP